MLLVYQYLLVNLGIVIRLGLQLCEIGIDRSTFSNIHNPPRIEVKASALVRQYRRYLDVNHRARPLFQIRDDLLMLDLALLLCLVFRSEERGPVVTHLDCPASFTASASFNATALRSASQSVLALTMRRIAGM